MALPPKRHIKSLTAQDGRELAAAWYAGANAHSQSVIMLAGLAIPQGALHGFAQFLAGLGWGVLVFDYRGVGKSRRDRDEERIDLDDWVDLDLPAAVAAVREIAAPQFLGVFAHSIGGQLLGQSPIRKEIDGALLIAAQRGIPRLFRGRGRISVWYAYFVFPILIKLLGRLPASKYTFPIACPAAAVRQWVRWGKSGVFRNRSGESVEARFSDVAFPLTVVTIADDSYAPAAAVEALTALYTNAAIRVKTIDPASYGGKPIGHFGFFHRHAPRALWEDAAAWLDEIKAVKPSPNRDLEGTK